MTEPLIYIIDDDEHTRILIEAQLKLLGKTQTFSNAHDVMQAMDHASFPDLIISDIDMPQLSGLDLLKWIREKTRTLPVILVSAFHSDENLVAALEMGATDFICKPFPLRNIRAAARNALKTIQPDGSFEIESNDTWISFTFDSSHEYLRRVNGLISTLVEKKTNKDTCNEIRLAIEEIGTNAIEWGNHNNPHLKVTIKYRLTPNKITLCIKDEGVGFSKLIPSENPQELLEKREAEGKRVGGYGINLVDQIMDEVIYSKSGSEIIMSKYLNRDDFQSGQSHQATEGS